jgi:hypothetical protein
MSASRWGTTHNHRIHLTRWAVTALAERHGSQDHHRWLPGPRRPQRAGDANVRLVLLAPSRSDVAQHLKRGGS